MVIDICVDIATGEVVTLPVKPDQVVFRIPMACEEGDLDEVILHYGPVDMSTFARLYGEELPQPMISWDQE